MRMYIGILAVGFLAAIALAGCASGLPAEVAKLNYVRRDLDFAMNIPDGWTWRESPGSVALIASAPATPIAPGAAENGRPNVTVVVEPAPMAMTLSEFVQMCRGQLSETLKKFTLIREEPRTLADGRKAWLLEFEHASLAKPVRQMQLVVMAGNRTYTVTATAEVSAFAAHEADFETIFRSFRAGW